MLDFVARDGVFAGKMLRGRSFGGVSQKMDHVPAAGGVHAIVVHLVVIERRICSGATLPVAVGIAEPGG